MNQRFYFLDRYAVWILLTVAFVLRLYLLDGIDFWYDEAFTGVALKESFHDMLVMIIDDVHPPLYYLLAKPFAALFGYSAFGIRLFSLIFGMFGVWGIYLFAKELLGRKVAVYALLLASVSPFAVQYSQEGRMYTMLGCLLIFASYFFMRALKSGHTQFYVLWGGLLGLAYLTHYLALLFAPLLFVVFVVWRYHEHPENFIKMKTVARLFLPNRGLLLGYGVSVLFFSPWISKFLVHFQVNNLDWIKPARLSDIFLNVQIFLFGIPRGLYSGMPTPNAFYGIDNQTVLIALSLFVVFVVFSLWKLDRFKLSVLLIFSVGLMLILFIQSLFGEHYLVARYVMPSAYFFFILLGFWLSVVTVRVRLATLTVYGLLLFAIIPVHYFVGYSQLARDVQRYEGKTLYVLNSFDYVIAKYYFGSEKLVLYNIDWPQYDSTAWAAIGQKLRRTEDFATLKEDAHGLILYNTQVNPRDRSDKSFDPSKFKLVGTYDNISVFESSPKVFFR